MVNKVLIIDDMHQSISQMLLSIGLEADYRPDIDRDEILRIVENYHIMIVRSKTIIDKELIDKATNLKIVARAGAGVDKLDLDYLTEKGIKVINAPEGNRDAVAEHALGMLLSLNNKLCQSNIEIRGYKWDREGNRGYELKGKTVGVFGFGYMGQAFAQRLSGFDVNVIAYDKYKTDYGTDLIEEVDLKTFFQKTQILSIHVPLTVETRGFFNKQKLMSFAELQVVINTARGEVLCLSDLCELLDSGKLRGACLDVLENEKLAKLSERDRLTFERLIHFDNVLLSPHVAGWTYESYERINKVIVEKLRPLL